jgi:SAM-dependent methyltransferase
MMVIEAGKMLNCRRWRAEDNCISRRLATENNARAPLSAERLLASDVNSTPEHSCQACGEHRLREIPGFTGLPRVTSDSKPFRTGGRLFVCGHCTTAQKIADETWLAEIAEIYRDYEMYHQSSANDQAVFDPQTGRARGRCEVLAQRLRESGALAESGTLLDVGAGSGAMLAAFSGTCAGWRLFGLDLDDRKAQALSAIPRFEGLFTVAPEQVLQQFDLITLIHSLEHFVDPLSMLRSLRERLAPGGRLFVQVNNLDKVPFDLVVADHLCHFTPRSLPLLLARAGFGVEAMNLDWINKEISLLADPQPESSAAIYDDPQEAIARIECEVAWLNRLLEHARKLAAGGGFGVFGTSVAATWLAAGLGDTVEFFVDEDPGRQERTHLGRPILIPGQVAPGAVVYLAFSPEVSSAIGRRLESLPIRFAAPPAAAA